MLVTSYLFLSNVHPFLATTDRVNANDLVIEGWIQQYALQAGADEFNTGSYNWIFATGGPVSGSGPYTSDYRTSASVGAEALKDLGVPDGVIEVVPSHVNGRDRTYSAAVALRDWFRDHDSTVQSINVLTEGCHARRTRFLYQKALGNNVRVGIISVANPDYNSRYWWRYSDGVREVIGESIAYVYARFLFHPPVSSRSAKTIQESRRPAGAKE